MFKKYNIIYLDQISKILSIQEVVANCFRFLGNMSQLIIAAMSNNAIFKTSLKSTLVNWPLNIASRIKSLMDSNRNRHFLFVKFE